MVAFDQQGPSDPRSFICLGHTSAVHASSGFDPLEPATPAIRFAIDHPEDRAGTMDEQRTEITIPALGHPEQRCFPARGMLTGYEAEPRGKLAPILERRRIAHSRYECRRGQGANAGQLGQPLTRLISLEHLRDLLVGGREALIEGLEFLGKRL